MHLKRWGVPITRRKKKTRVKPRQHWKQKKSEWLLARQKENTKINDSKIEYIQFEHSTEDQRLIDNILRRPIIG